MLLGFKSRFAPFIEDGRKTHTIRGIRKRAPRVGEICHCYMDPRRKTMRLLGRWPCVRIERILIDTHRVLPSGNWKHHIWIEGTRLTNDECEVLARADGFPSFADMMEFWRGRLPFEGQIIHWDYGNPVKVFKKWKKKIR
jgi:hypothetical protein